MIRLSTPVDCCVAGFQLTFDDRIMILGSCFADNIGERKRSAGFDVCVNPFGTLYNPASIAAAIERLDSAEPFREEECVEMGAGAGKICSYMHHTSFARDTREEFLDNANSVLKESSAFWKSCSKLIVTLGTAYVWTVNGRVVSNCLKRPSSEFGRRMMGVDECTALIRSFEHAGKNILLTVSPIRHFSDGAHSNTLSKSTLHLAASASGFPYFPAYEILQDELRDYRYYAEDLVHPSKTAVDIIWERFMNAIIPVAEHSRIAENEKASRAALHREILKKASKPSYRTSGQTEP